RLSAETRRSSPPTSPSASATDPPCSSSASTGSATTSPTPVLNPIAASGWCEHKPGIGASTVLLLSPPSRPLKYLFLKDLPVWRGHSCPRRPRRFLRSFHRHDH